MSPPTTEPQAGPAPIVYPPDQVGGRPPSAPTTGGAAKPGNRTTELYKLTAVAAGGMGLAYEAGAPEAVRLGGLACATLCACFYGWLRYRTKVLGEV